MVIKGDAGAVSLLVPELALSCVLVLGVTASCFPAPRNEVSARVRAELGSSDVRQPINTRGPPPLATASCFVCGVSKEGLKRSI
ncbi:Hypothetical predicted protein [Cloeon dipterum]|uniref:Uncharacterized protein n=1 Tax=Cloeon dipterum TaxID=197152 RepID=A0A8S1C9R6_9INSE|nr:Hypothetical predicted protein [Cloeon dipterum]